MNNGVTLISEGANMPSVPAAVDLFVDHGLLYGDVQSTFLTFFTVQVTDDNGDTATQDLSIRVTLPGCYKCHSN